MVKRFFQTISSGRPLWSKHLTDRQYKLFREKLLKASGNTIDTDNCDSAGLLIFEDKKMDVSNLTKVCSALPEEEWGEEIARWIRVFSEESPGDAPAYPKDIHMLQLQLYPVGYFGSKKEEQELLVREDLPGVLTTIVIDEPDKLTTPTKDYLTEWTKHLEQTFDLLVERIRQQTPHTAKFIKLDGSEDNLVAVLIGNEITSANHVLALDVLYPQLIGDTGALVALPQRHMILVKRLETKPSKGLIKSFGYLVQHTTQGRADVISKEVYRFYQGKFQAIH